MTMKRLAPLALLLAALGCQQAEKAPAAPKAGGNAGAGRAAIDKYGCANCHIIPGVDAPRGTAAPSLEHLKSRPLLAGKMPNSQENVAKWMQNPQAVDPMNTMPNLAVTPKDAEDIAAFLYSQQ